jgi:hypothetical protein
MKQVMDMVAPAVASANNIGEPFFVGSRSIEL